MSTEQTQTKRQLKPKIHEAMLKIFADVKVIGKDETNKHQGFNYRGIDQVYNSMHSIFAKHEVYCIPKVELLNTEERETSTGKVLITRIIKVDYEFIASDGSSVTSTIISEANDTADKAMNKAQSIAHKYCLFQVFMIPTGEDPDGSYDEAQAGKQSASAGKKTTTTKPGGGINDSELNELKKLIGQLPDQTGFLKGFGLKFLSKGLNRDTFLKLKKQAQDIIDMRDTGLPTVDDGEPENVPDENGVHNTDTY